MKNVNKICIGLVYFLAATGKIFGSHQRTFCKLENRFKSVLENYSPLEDQIPWEEKEDITLLSVVIKPVRRTKNSGYNICWHNIDNETIKYLGRSFSNVHNRFNVLQRRFTVIFGKNITCAFQIWTETHQAGTMEEFLQEIIQNPLYPQEYISRIKLIRILARRTVQRIA
jgi:hypothetical protein